MTHYWKNIPEHLIEHILDYTYSKDNIINYFKNNIAPLIDTTFIKIDNGCSYCHLKYFYKNKIKKCYYHKYIKPHYNNSIIENPKFLSLYNLPNTELYYDIGKLFLAINDVTRFKKIITNLKPFQDHVLSDINREIIFNKFALE